MSFGFLWKSAVAVALGTTLGFLALSMIKSVGEQQQPANPARHFVPRLSLIRQATTGQLVSLQIGPFEVGTNDFRVTLLNPIGQPQRLDSAQLRLSRLESAGIIAEVDAGGSGVSKEGRILVATTGWWQFEVIANGNSTATFYLKLDQPSSAPDSFAPPAYANEEDAQRIFQAALARYEGLSGLRWREELTSGDPGPSRYGVWFITNINANRQGYHATTLNLDQGTSELYSDDVRQCFRQARDAWQCSVGPSPIVSFDLSYLRNASGFKKGVEEVLDGEMTQVIFFYNQSQGAWYVWWIGEETGYLRRQAMVANGHFMLDRFSDHDLAQQIQPKDLPPS